jgi:hypothetical protein
MEKVKVEFERNGLEAWLVLRGTRGIAVAKKLDRKTALWLAAELLSWAVGR